MATVQPTPTLATSVPQPLPAHLRRLYRAFVTPQNPSDPERTFYVEAVTHQAAAKKIAGTIVALEYTKLQEAAETVYNVTSVFELIHEGVSDALEARLFEAGRSGDRVCAWVEAPVFLVREPAALMRAWARIPQGVRS